MAQHIAVVFGNERRRRKLAGVDNRPLCIDACLRHTPVVCKQEVVDNFVHYRLLETTEVPLDSHYSCLNREVGPSNLEAGHCLRDSLWLRAGIEFHWVDLVAPLS